MASARRTGTNETTNSFGNAGRDYTSISVWESATDVNLVATTTSYVLQGYADSASYNQGNIAVADATTSTSYFRIIENAPGEAFELAYTHATITQVLAGFENNTVFQSHESGGTFTVSRSGGNSTGSLYGIRQNSAGHTIGLLIKDITNAGTGLGTGYNVAGGPSGAIDCVIRDCKSNGFNFGANTGNFAYNCTAIGNATGFNVTSTTPEAKNCLGSANTTADFAGTWGTANNNASSDTTAPGTSSRISQTFTFEADGYHLSPSDAGAQDFGADLSGDAVFPFDDDFDATLWSGTLDIGATQATSAPGGEVLQDILGYGGVIPFPR